MAQLIVPLDASGIEGLDPRQPVKVLLTSAGKPVSAQSVTFDRKGAAEATFDVESARTGLRVLVGPADADDDELTGLQTIGVDVPRRRFKGREELRLPPIRISAYYWSWWLRWCRTFTIHGRVVCPDGSPVPGAVVCAYDVDAWWWWWSRQQVGCATTDATGSFTITFRWCCGWWPWWWLRRRHWYVEPRLADLIVGALQREPRFPRPPLPDPVPDLGVFDRLLGEAPSPGPLPTVRAVKAPLAARDASHAVAHNVAQSLSPSAQRLAGRAVDLDVAQLDALRDRLVPQLPQVPALQHLRLWPWSP